MTPSHQQPPPATRLQTPNLRSLDSLFGLKEHQAGGGVWVVAVSTIFLYLPRHQVRGWDRYSVEMWIPGSRRFRTSLRVIKSPAQSQSQLYHQAIVCHISSGLGRHKKAPSQNNLNNNYINVSATKSVLMSARIFSAKPQIDNRSNYVN